VPAQVAQINALLLSSQKALKLGRVEHAQPLYGNQISKAAKERDTLLRHFDVQLVVCKQVDVLEHVRVRHRNVAPARAQVGNGSLACTRGPTDRQLERTRVGRGGTDQNCCASRRT
jgi:hypothetical protein